MKRVTISKKKRRHFERMGSKAIRDKLITGFQLEDFNPRARRNRVQYAHDNPTHLRAVKRGVRGGKIYPRESHYKWEDDWTPGANTTVYRFKKHPYARAKEEYFSSHRPARESSRFFRRKCFKTLSKKPLEGSWVVPDIRAYGNALQDHSRYGEAYQVTKSIDHNSRFSTVVTTKKRARKLQRALPGRETVKKVRIQDYAPRKQSNPSFWSFIHRNK